MNEKSADLTADELEDLRDRWRVWRGESEIEPGHIDALRDEFAGSGPTDDEREAHAFAGKALFEPPLVAVTPLVHQIASLVPARVPELDGFFDKTPVLVVPVLKYRAFVNTLQSGRPYVGLTLLSLLQPYLIAEHCSNALEAASEENRSGFEFAVNRLITCVWHLESLNHESTKQMTANTGHRWEEDHQCVQMALSMTAFQLLHESAHIFLAHSFTNDPAQIRSQEFEADEKAIEWWYQLFSPRENWDIPVVGLISFFRVHALHQALTEKEFRSHPSWVDRLERIKAHLLSNGIPPPFIEITEATFSAIDSIAMRTILIAKDADGRMQGYNNPAGTLDAVNLLAFGQGSINVIIIGPDGTPHDKTFTAESIAEFVKQRGTS